MKQKKSEFNLTVRHSDKLIISILDGEMICKAITVPTRARHIVIKRGKRK